MVCRAIFSEFISYFKIVIFLSLFCHEGFGQIVNLASTENGATCYASSNYDAFTTCEMALDSSETPVSSEWVSDRDGASAFMDITFYSRAEVHEVKFLQRCYYVDMASQVRLTFDDGTIQLMDLSCEGGGNTATSCDDVTWQSVRIDSRPVAKSVRITVLNVCYPANYVGFREVGVLGIPLNTYNLALSKNGGSCIASSEDDSGDYDCNNAIDTDLDFDENSAWQSAYDQYIGEWIQITLPTLSNVTSVRLLNRCGNFRYQMSEVAIEMDAGFLTEVDLTCYGGSSPNCEEQEFDEFTFENILTSSVTIRGLTSCSNTPNTMGFSEVEVYGTQVVPEPGSCPRFFSLALNGTTCYQIVYRPEDEKTRSDAKEACTAVSPTARLVEINSADEQQYISSALEAFVGLGSTCENYYTNGLRLSDEATDWYWETDFELIPPADRYWGPGEPADTGVYMALSRYENGTAPWDWAWAASTGLESACYVCEETPN